MEAWLQGKPREVAVAFAARAALRVLPLVQNAKRDESYTRWYFVLPVFRATSISCAAAKYPAHEMDAAHRAAAAEDDAVFLARSADAVFLARSAAAVAVATTAAATTAITIVAAATAADAGARAVNSADYGSFGPGFSSDFTTARTATDAFWSALSTDAARVEEGAAGSVIAGSPLWPHGQPVQLRSLWQEMKAELLAAMQDWEVWTIWYEDRLEGRVREEERELAYVRIDNHLWNQGPAIVNAEIKRRIALHEPPPIGQSSFPEPSRHRFPAAAIHDFADFAQPPFALIHEPPPLPAPIENVPSAVSFGWTSKGTVTVVLGELNWPAFPFKGGEQDHKHRLEACRSLATDTARSLRSGRWNARQDYVEILDQYVVYLPVKLEDGNFLLADAEARIIRGMFASDAYMLPMPLAERLKVFLQQHIGLRAYYPATEDFYESVRSGHLEAPLPIDAVEGFIQDVRDNTPTLFEPNVSQSLEGVAQPIPSILPIDAEAAKSDVAQPMPPPDPLGEVDPEESRRYTVGGAVNALWKVVLSGKKIDDNLESWMKVAQTLGPKVAKILDWLQNTL